MYAIAYVIIPTEFASLQAVLDEALAPFRRGGPDEFPRDKLAFDDVTDEIRKLQREPIKLQWEDGRVVLQSEDMLVGAWDFDGLTEFLRSTEAPTWSGCLADIDPDLDAFARRFTTWKQRDADAVESQFALRLMFARRLRNPGLLAAGRIVGPDLRQIKPHVDGRVPPIVRQNAEYRDLAIVDLAQPPRPLPGDADRAVPLLGEAAFVDDQRAGRLAAQKSVRIPADLRHYGFVVPWRFADEMLKLLRTAAFNYGGHRFERTILRLRQPPQVTARHGRVVSRARAEKMTMSVVEGSERRRDLLDQRSGQPSSEHTVTRRIAKPTSPPLRESIVCLDIESTRDSRVKTQFPSGKTRAVIGL